MSAKSRAQQWEEHIAIAYYKWEFPRRSKGYRQDNKKFDRGFGPRISKNGRHSNMRDRSNRALEYYFRNVYPAESRRKWTAGREVSLDEESTTCSNLDEVQRISTKLRLSENH